MLAEVDPLLSSYFPCLLVCLVGPHLSLYGAVWNEEFVVDPICSTSLLFSKYDVQALKTVAKTLKLIKILKLAIIRYYNQGKYQCYFNTSDPTNIPPQYPYCSKFNGISYKYLKRIHKEKLIYEMENERTNEQVIVKFCHRYGAEVQR